MHNFLTETESESTQNVSLWIYEPFLENIQDISLTNQQKKVFIENYWKELDNILKSLKDLCNKADLENFNWTDLLDLWLKILEKLEEIKLLVNCFLEELFPKSNYSINHLTYITCIKSNQLIIDNSDSNPCWLEEIKEKVQEILIKLKSNITTMNTAESKYYWWELMQLWNQLLKIEPNKQI